LKFLFEFKLQLGFSPLTQSSPPGWLNPTGSGLGRSNQPSPAPLSHPSLPRVALANPNRHRNILYPLLQLDSSAASSPRRSVAGSRLGSAGSGRLQAQCLTGPLLVLAVQHRGGRGVCARRWKHPRSGAPGAAAVKTSPGSPQRPRGHCPAMPSRHAPGHLVSVLLSSSSSLLSSPAMVTGHLAMPSVLSSQTCFCQLLANARLLCGFS
jgi:hypothetical protein